MIQLKGVNMNDVLRDERRKRVGWEDQHALIKTGLGQEGHDDILKKIFGSKNEINKLEVHKLDPEKVFYISDIKNICIGYRLRFLSAAHFKGDIPTEALQKVADLQREHSVDLKGFMVLAPAGLFNLKERDKDPLLFANLGNGFFYLIHQWGKEMSPWRKILVFPMRSFETLFFSVLALAFSIAAAVPGSVMMGPNDTTSLHIRVIFFFYLFFAFSSLAALYGFSRMKNFSIHIWNSRYFD
jgi:hypothetical protein